MLGWYFQKGLNTITLRIRIIGAEIGTAVYLEGGARKSVPKEMCLVGRWVVGVFWGGEANYSSGGVKH